MAKYSQEEIDGAVSQGFSDIESGVWYEKYADFGKQKGFISGYTSTPLIDQYEFGGEKNINFAEAAKLVMK